jgi:bud site selection protein 20
VANETQNQRFGSGRILTSNVNHVLTLLWQIDEDIKPENAEKLVNQEVDHDKTGGAQFYCVHCARYFIDNHALHDHFKTKVHKRRLKALELEPYSIEESERAAGLGSWKAPEKRKIETVDVDNSESKKSKTE